MRAVPYFLQIAGTIYVCFVYFAAIAQVWINFNRQNVFYPVMLWKGSQVPREEDEEEAVTKKAIKELFVVCFFSITLLYHFFSTFCLPTTFTHTHDPRPLPTTHDPRPTTFSYTPKWWTQEIFMECYCVARNKPIRSKRTKPQTATVISLRFACVSWTLLWLASTQSTFLKFFRCSRFSEFDSNAMIFLSIFWIS